MQILRCLSMGVAFGCLPLTILAQRQLVPVTLPGQLPVVRQVVAPPRDFVEICTAIEAGRAIVWQFGSRPMRRWRSTPTSMSRATSGHPRTCPRSVPPKVA